MPINKIKIMMILVSFLFFTGCSGKKNKNLNSDTTDSVAGSKVSNSELKDQAAERNSSLALNEAGNASNVVDPNQASIQSIKFTGKGCPVDSTDVLVAPDQKSFSVIFSNFALEADAKNKTITRRKGCYLTLKIYIPEGSSFTNLTTQTRGFSFLKKNARLKSRADFLDGRKGRSKKMYRWTFKGLLDRDHLFEQKIFNRHMKWSNYQSRIKTIRFHTSLNLKVKKRSYGETVIDSIDGLIN
ncbi:MAG: hypothetical protein CMP10_01450 [Zetaproteobacteria bacterium]|nr:hypothetical protein [Pseudobdellovibrionaceae bacterium]